MDKLIFIYNANSGIFNGTIDYVHKIISPKTYNCNLCAITYGNLGMKKKWKKYITSLPIKTEFLHKNEFNKKYGINEELPAIFLESNDKIKLIISADEINTCKNIEDFIHLIKEKNEKYIIK
ncbi:hypothetical protein HOD20_06640 [archaeon]|jgi:hypothetical protein|nr:hypothetical protein [archaeon]MBT4647923.1 hypothetical protein [archaeon]MBT7393157.1 hypothetical protein [archaeon]